VLYITNLVLYDENGNDPVVLTWKDVVSGGQNSRSTPSDNHNEQSDASLNVLESLLNFKNVNVQVGGTTQRKPKEMPAKQKPANKTTNSQLISSSQSSKVWPSSASVHSNTFDLESVENAIRLSESTSMVLPTVHFQKHK
jgi:hypothetical protein